MRESIEGRCERVVHMTCEAYRKANGLYDALDSLCAEIGPLIEDEDFDGLMPHGDAILRFRDHATVALECVRPALTALAMLVDVYE